MGSEIIGIIILFAVFFTLLILRTPIAFALGISSLVTVIYLKLPIIIVFQQMAKGVQAFSLIAIPFFIVAGEIMGQGGMSKKLIDFADVLVGRMRGGLGQVNIVASMFFGGISGSAIADVSSIGAFLIPVMKKSGYPADVSVAVTVTSSCQGIVIPPSQVMIIYAVAAGGVSISKLFMAGIIPGVLLGVALMVAMHILAVKYNYPRGDKVTLKQAAHTIKDSILCLFTGVIIIGGVLLGWFTATESAAIASLYALIISVFVYKAINIKTFINIIKSTLGTLALVFTLISAANIFGWLLAYLRVSTHATNLLLSVSSNKIVILLLINLLLLFLGTVMDMAPLVLIVTPVLLPIVNNLGMNSIQFGIMLILNLAIGLCTPPVGSAIFVGCAIGKISIEEAMKGIWPFYISMLAILMLVTFVPEIVMIIPNLMS